MRFGLETAVGAAFLACSAKAPSGSIAPLQYFEFGEQPLHLRIVDEGDVVGVFADEAFEAAARRQRVDQRGDLAPQQQRQRPLGA